MHLSRAIVLLLALAAPALGAHEESPQGPAPEGYWRAQLTSPADVLPRVRVTLSQGTPPALLLENTGATAVTVLGAGGEPFLRIGPDGVDVNLASASWRQQHRYRGLQRAGAGARWHRVSTAPRYAWIEPRIAAGAPHWRVPLEAPGRKAEIAGTLEWVPLRAAAARR